MGDARLLNSSSGDRNSKASIWPETIKIQAVIVCPRIIVGRLEAIAGRLEASQLHMGTYFRAQLSTPAFMSSRTWLLQGWEGGEGGGFTCLAASADCLVDLEHPALLEYLSSAPLVSPSRLHVSVPPLSLS